jgi:hypothetical protein
MRIVFGERLGVSPAQYRRSFRRLERQAKQRGPIQRCSAMTQEFRCLPPMRRPGSGPAVPRATN